MHSFLGKPLRRGRGYLVASLAILFSSTLLAQNYLSQGQQLTAVGKYDDALLIYDLLKQQDVKDARTYIYSGAALLEAGREQDAAMELNLALRYKPARAEDALSLARSLERLDRLPTASQVLEDFLAESTLPPEGLHYLTQLYLRQKRGDEALSALNRFAARTPADSRVAPLRGEIQLLRGDLEAALSAFEASVIRSPQDPELRAALGRTLLQGNNPQAGRKAFQEAINLAPSNPEYLHLLGLACSRLGEYAEAIQHLEKAAGLPQASSQIQFDLGNAYRVAGQSEKAREALATYQTLNAQAEDEKNTQQKLVQLVNQARQQMEQGQVREAHDSLQRAAQIDPHHFPVHSMLAMIYLSSGMAPQAEAEIKEMDRINPDTSEGNYLAAMYWYQMKETDKALERAEKARRLRPGNPDLRNLLGNLYLAKDRRPDALRAYLAATKLAPDRLDFKANYDTLNKKMRSN